MWNRLLTTVTLLVTLTSSNIPYPTTITPTRAGNALGTEYLANCSNEAANPSPAREEQLDFFKGKEVHIGHHDDPGSYWLDYSIGYEGERWSGIGVRYFAGSRDEQPCTFGLVLFSNAQEINEAQARYFDGSTTLPPSEAEEMVGCRSEYPPVIAKENGNVVAIMTCD